MSQKFEKLYPSQATLERIRFLILDVDGVMTDGSITYTSSGDEIKTFNCKDGPGIKYWVRSGHAVGIISGRESVMVSRRAKELGIAFLKMNEKLKLPAFESMLAEAGVEPDEVAMIGDDLLDLPILRRVGLPIAVADAVDEVKEVAAWITALPGGRGAVREVTDVILKAQGKWDAVMARYLV